MKYLAIAPLFMLLLACSSADQATQQSASQVSTSEGPQFFARANYQIDDDLNTILVVHLSLQDNSIITSYADGQASQRFEFSVRISDETGNTVFSDKQVISLDTDEIGRNSQIQKKVPVPHGAYNAEVTVTDKSNNNSNTVALYKEIPNLEEETIILSNVIVSTVEDTLSSVQGDTVNIQYQLVNRSDQELSVYARLYQISTDNQLPRRMGLRSPSRGSIQFQGIDLTDRTLLESDNYTIDYGDYVQTKSLSLDIEETGYFVVRVTVEDDNREVLASNEESFTYFGQSFPYVNTVKDMADALFYLMTRSEYRNLLAAETEEDMKQKMDQFWLSNIEDRAQAAEVINLYFTRVEQANRFFSGYKQGWMTDKGYVYILFGAPMYIEKYFDRETWVYGPNRYTDNTVFQFRRGQVRSSIYDHSHYILERRGHSFTNNYEAIEYDRISEWLSGYILRKRDY